MRWREIVSEDRTPLRKALVQASPNLVTYSVLNNNNHPYLAYRFGVALAPAPDDRGHAEGPIGSDFTMVDYTDADRIIRQSAEKKMGISPNRSTGNGSLELSSVNTQSPIQPKGPVRPRKT